MGDGLTPETKRDIAGRASTLIERANRFSERGGADGPQGDDGDETVITEWRDVYETDRQFRDRLAREGLEPAECRTYARTVRWPDGTPPPDWVETLDELVRFVATWDSDDDATPETDVPFVEVLSPVADFAVQTLESQATLDRFSDAAMASLREWLLDRLQRLSARAFFVEFRTVLETRGFDPDAVDTGEEPPTERYESFVRRVRTDGLERVFEVYPVLARLLIRTVRQWTASVSNLAKRLRSDWNALTDTFDASGAPTEVTEIELLSKDHHDGEVPARLQFDSGISVVYKPRPVEMEASFFGLLDWFDRHTSLPELYSATVLCRDGYGWMEWVDATSCDDREAVVRYYRRAGMVSCLAYALNFVDGHYENVVPAGEQPVIVDLETLFHLDLSGEQLGTDRLTTLETQRSVLRTDLLPWQGSKGDRDRVSGFDPSTVEIRNVDVPEWEHVNTDLMDLSYETVYRGGRTHLPDVDGSCRSPTAHRNEIVNGFEAMYATLRAEKSRLLAPDGPLEEFRHVEGRFLFRSTKQYSRVLFRLCSPKTLQSGVRVTIESDRLAPPFFSGEITDAGMWDLYERERKCLERMNVPRFTFRTTGTDVLFQGAKLADGADETPMQRVRTRLASLSESDLETQLEYVRSCLERTTGRHDGTSREAPIERSRPVSNCVLSRRVRELYEELASGFRPDKDGSLSWITRGFQEETGRLRVHEPGNELYGGRSGAAVFLAALHETVAEVDCESQSRALIAPTRDLVEREDPADFTGSLGVCVGLGSSIYALTRMATLLDDPELLRDAHRASGFVTEDRVADAAAIDVTTGVAGALLALLTLYDVTSEEESLTRAVRCGEALLSRRIESPEGYRVWPSDTGEPLTGLSHGASGIAYALVRLGDASGESRFERAAREALEFERQFYSPARNNWADVRSTVDHEFMDGWCYGRSGIGLARIGIDSYSRSLSVTDDLRRALGDGGPTSLGRDDHLCCGNAGRAAFLVTAGHRLGRTDCIERARSLLRETIARASDRGFFATAWRSHAFSDPRLFRGASGIGYVMLRAMDPDGVPCLTLFE